LLAFKVSVSNLSEGRVTQDRIGSAIWAISVQGAIK